jgi:uncharacterized protein YndB with AHSA1/START domain
MSKVSMKTSIDAPVARVWQTVGGFNAIPDWHPAVEASALEGGGKRRRLKLAGGGELVEEQLARDDGKRSYSYSILSGPLPVANYRATITVREEKDGSATVEWASDFEPVGSETDAVETIQQVYRTGLENLRKMFGG